MAKSTSLKIVILWNHLDWCLETHWPEITHFSGILLSHIFPLDRNDMSSLEPKANPFKTILIWEEMLRVGSPSMICVVARSRQTIRMKKKERKKKIDCHVMHLKNSIKSKRKSRKPNSKKFKKMKNCYLFPRQELLFSLGNYVWDEKWSSFIIPSLI